MTDANDMAFALNDDRGLSKREYFAAMAMQGMLSNDHYTRNAQESQMMIAAVKAADTLINALNHKQ